MKQKSVRWMLVSIAVVTLSGCGRIVDWSNNNFYQGEDVEPFTQVPQAYLRTLYLYDQLSTAGIFDALWLSDAVRTAYASAHAAKLGKDEDFRIKFLRRQLEENKHFITFYLMSDRHTLEERDAAWSLFLQVNDQVYSPVEIKIIDIGPEYRAFFGARYNVFKTQYVVKFSAFTPDEKPILTKDTATISLHVKSVFKEGVMTWRVPRSEQSKPSAEEGVQV